MFDKKVLPGLFLSIIVGSIAMIVAQYTPSILNSVILGLLFGMLVGNLISVPKQFSSGISLGSSKFLEFSILFLAFSINYTSIAQLGSMNFVFIATIVLFILLITIFLSKKLNCPGNTGYLIGFGTAICGSSAIAALAPTISDDKNSEDVAVAMSVVNLLGSVGMLTMPIILMQLNLSDASFGMLLGGSLQSVGNVAGAGYSVSNEVGELALTIKLARVALLSPALLFFNYLLNRGKGKSLKQMLVLPWYLIGFFAISILVSFVSFPEWFIQLMELLGKTALTISMAAIGMKVSFKSLISSGKKGFSFGLIIFGILITLLSLSLMVKI